MKRKELLAIVLVGAMGVAVGQKTRPAPEASAPAYSQAEVAAMKADVQRMRSLVTQMQNNLGFVGSTTMPLRHQFELEIEMWQVEIAGLERRTAAAEKSRQP